MLYKGVKVKKIKNKKLAIILFVAVIIIFICLNYNNIKQINFQKLIAYISKHGEYAEVCFLIIFALKTLLIFLPSSMLSIVSGTIFGPIVGFLLNMAGFFLSASLAFYLSRYLGKDFVDKILKGKAVNINSNMEKNGFKILMLIRVTPVIPYDPISYACGLSKIKYKDFILASLLGVLPETLCYAFMGENIFNPLSYQFIIPMGLVILVLGITTCMYKKRK